MQAVTVNPIWRRRIGRLIGNIYSAGLDEKDVYTHLGISRSTWSSYKSGLGSEKNREQVIEYAEKFVDSILSNQFN